MLKRQQNNSPLSPVVYCLVHTAVDTLVHFHVYMGPFMKYEQAMNVISYHHHPAGLHFNVKIFATNIL